MFIVVFFVFGGFDFLDYNLQCNYFICIGSNVFIFNVVKVVLSVEIYFKVQIIRIKFNEKLFNEIFI